MLQVMSWLGKQYPRQPVQIAVLVLWAALLVVGIYGSSQMRVDADRDDFIPAGSYLNDWLFVQEEYFQDNGPNIRLYWVDTEEVSFFSLSRPVRLAYFAGPQEQSVRRLLLGAAW
jgi:hypothetical protein